MPSVNATEETMSPPALDYIDNPLEWADELTLEDRSQVHANVRTDLPSILPRILFRGGIGPADEQNYPDRPVVLHRIAEVAVERTVSFMSPAKVEVLHTLYRHAPRRVNDARSYADITGATLQNSYSYIHKAGLDLRTYSAKIVDGTIDYEQSPTGGKLGIDRYNALLLLARLGATVPILGSMSDLQTIALNHLNSSVTLSDEEKAIVASVYRIDDKKLPSTVEIGRQYGYDRRTILNIANRATSRMAEPSALFGGEETPAARLRLLPESDPKEALALIRTAVSEKTIDILGITDSFIDTYAEALCKVIALKQGTKPILENFEDNPKNIIRSAYKAIFRYCSKSGSLVERSMDRDVAILERYLYDAKVLQDKGMPQPNRMALYMDPDKVEALYDANSDISKHYINMAIRSCRANPEQGIENFRRNITKAEALLADSVYLTPGLIRDYCTKHADSYMERLRLYEKIVHDTHRNYQLDAAVTTDVIKYFMGRNLASTTANINAWLTRREALIQCYPIKTYPDCDRWLLGIIARSRLAKDNSKIPSTNIDSHKATVELYLNNLNSVRKKYASSRDIDRYVIKAAAQAYVGDAERGLRNFRLIRETLQKAFAGDTLVDEDVIWAFSQHCIANHPGFVTKRVLTWKDDYVLLRERYKDAPEIDDAILRTVLIRWPRRPEVGIQIMLAIRRRRIQSLDNPLAAAKNGPIDGVRDSSSDPADIIEKEAERKLQRISIIQRIAALDEAEQQAVLITYGLEEVLGDEVDIEKICRILNTQDLTNYVQDVVMPKLRKAAATDEL